MAWDATELALSGTSSPEEIGTLPTARNGRLILIGVRMVRPGLDLRAIAFWLLRGVAGSLHAPPVTGT